MNSRGASFPLSSISHRICDLPHPCYLLTPVGQPAITFYKLSPIFETQLETAYCNCMPKTCVMTDIALARLKEMTSTQRTQNTDLIVGLMLNIWRPKLQKFKSLTTRLSIIGRKNAHILLSLRGIIVNDFFPTSRLEIFLQLFKSFSDDRYSTSKADRLFCDWSLHT